MTPVVDTSPVTADAASPARANRNVLTAAKGGGIVFAGSLFTYGVRFFIGLLLARLLGAEQLGLYDLALTAATVAAGLTQFGFKAALVRYVSLFASRKDREGLWGTLQIGLGLPALLSLPMVAGLYFLAVPIADGIFQEPRLVPLLRLASFIIPFLTLPDLVAAATQGFKKMQYTVIGQNISEPVVRLLLLAALALTGLTAAKAVTAFGLAMGMVTFLLIYFLHKLFSLRRPLRAARHEFTEIFRFSLPVYLSALIGTFGGNVQTVLLGALNTVTTVGVFAVATRVNLIGSMFHQSVVTSSRPIVSELYGQGEREQMKQFYQTITKWTFTVNLPMFLITFLFATPILSIFGESFVGGGGALVILAWANLVDASTGICGVLLDMSGNTSFKLVNSVVTMFATLGLNFLLIPTWGLLGAAVASLVAVALINLLRLLEVFILLRMLPYNLTFVKPILAGLAAWAVAWAVGHTFATQVNVFYVLGNIALLVAIYGGVILLLGLSQEDRAVLASVTGRMRTALLKSKGAQ
jgi:O-antigen/teichoic acid export membrane protein